MPERSVLEELQDSIFDYNSVVDFVNKYKKIYFYQFDSYIVSKISLFLIHENIDLAKIRANIEKIKSNLPALISIFERPIIHLKEVEDIMPIEMVHKISNDTIAYGTVHSELWDSISSNGLKPRKLLTRTYSDNYSIYENQVFAQTIDDITSYFRHILRLTKNLIFASKIINMNILDRLKHINYYLAIGKLHTGYIRNFEKYHFKAEELNKEVQSTMTLITVRKKYKVYRFNKHRNKRLSLKLTNILKMQKNYHKMYLLSKQINNIAPALQNFSDEELENYFNGYYYYCVILLIFSLSHFGFETDEKNEVDFDKLNLVFTNGDWKLLVKAGNVEKQRMILLHFKKDVEYKIVLVPDDLTDDQIFEKMKIYKFNEIVGLTPFDNKDKFTYISISDVDSFLRFQQIIFRGMLYSDEKHEVCPFCGEALTKLTNTNNEEWLCESCKTRIAKMTCERTKQDYYTTTINGYYVKVNENGSSTFNNDTSELMHFRNVTKISETGDAICPHCGRKHY